MVRTSLMIALLLGLAGLALAEAPAVTPQNLLKNPGFETVDAAGLKPVDWTVSVWSSGEDQKTGKADVELCADAHGGKQAIKIRWLEGSKNIVVGSAPVAVKPGETYKATVFVKSTANRPWMSLLTAGPGKGQIDYVHSKNPKNTGDWEMLEAQVTVSEGAEGLIVFLRTDGDGTIYDDVTLAKPAP